MIAIGYARLSDKDSSSNSIKNQIKRIEEYCERYNFTLKKVFVDDGKSGWTFDRPGFIELESYCKQHKDIQYLVIPHFDRFSRADPVDAMVKERYFRDKLSIKVLQVSESPDIDVNNPTYLIVRFMQAFAANEERNRIVDRVKTGIHFSLMQGRYSGKAPVGYLNGRDTQNKALLIIDENKRKAIELIYKNFLNNVPVEKIKQLSKDHGLIIRGKSGVQELIANPVYAGLINVPVYKDKPARLVKGLHQAIVSESTYYQCLNILKSKNHRFHPSEDVPLRGILKCHCGKFMTAAPSKGRNKLYWYYFCNDHRKGNYSADKLHKQLNTILEALSINNEDLTNIKLLVQKEINQLVSVRSKEIMRLNLAIEKAKKSIEAIEEKYLLSEGAISEESFKKTITAKRIELSRLQDEILVYKETPEAHYQKLDLVFNKLSDLAGHYEKMSLIQKQNLIKLCFGYNLMYDSGVYRTAFINPVFKYNALILKEKGLEVLPSNPSDISAFSASAPERS